MIKTSMNRVVLPVIGLVMASGIATAVAVHYIWREPVVDRSGTSVAPKPVADERTKGPAALAAAQSEANAVAAALAGSTAPESGDGNPAFDVARIEPTGEAVIAGRATPGVTVELLRNGELHDRVIADQSGQFAMVPPLLPPGTYDLTLRAKQPDGRVTTSKQSVTVALEPNLREQPVVALMTPNKPTVVLSQPAQPKQETAAVVVEAVEIEAGGKFHVSGRARSGAPVRLYLNDSFIASVTAGADGRFAVTVNEGIGPGNYRVRLDEVDSKSGTVRGRAEVPFNAPDPVVTASVPPRTSPTKQPDSGALPQSKVADAAGAPLPDVTNASTVVVPKITTTTVSRGDSLWRISQATYGAGTRYATIYKANREQIRNPNLIYPGQIFVIPNREANP
ncbi:LysM peptidoglycan-binding domain-containing protein [Bradyrhizobium archetypum]|uniref:LysM peptidoglycan-binding domain-containing protein n=1 Tax=Bradyrhizobium archetypum TaxID=2721160 RepID=A0A7Y4H0Y9_9BRAD|nr:LysM peptidoglycan-binding domain-containing protein [Bradyrhizobium archetypum]NOJ45620.1 LysM peptidoglycan-binding domain-containing protein [Bradyrhizobium archetypum]